MRVTVAANFIVLSLFLVVNAKQAASAAQRKSAFVRDFQENVMSTDVQIVFPIRIKSCYLRIKGSFFVIILTALKTSSQYSYLQPSQLYAKT